MVKLSTTKYILFILLMLCIGLFSNCKKDMDLTQPPMGVLETTFKIDLGIYGDTLNTLNTPNTPNTLNIQYSINSNKKLKYQLWDETGEFDIETMADTSLQTNTYQYSFNSDINNDTPKQLYFYDAALESSEFKFNPIAIYATSNELIKTITDLPILDCPYELHLFEINEDKIASYHNFSLLKQIIHFLKPDKKYAAFVAHNCDGYGILTGPISFKTDKIPGDISGLNILSNKNITGKFLLNQLSLANGGSNILKIADANGEIVWYRRFKENFYCYNLSEDKQSIIVGFSDIMFTPDAITYEKSELLKFSFTGDTLQHFILEDKILHHELFEQNKHFYTLSFDIRSYKYEEDTDSISIYSDEILNINELGETIWSWRFLDVYNPSDFEFKDFDWTHGNALTINNNNLFYSAKNHNRIYEINSTTNKVVSIFGSEAAHSPLRTTFLATDASFENQHSLNYTKEQKILIFDNGSADRARSRVLEIERKGNEYVKSWEMWLPEDAASTTLGNVQPINNEDLLLVSSGQGIIYMVNRDSEILFEANSPIKFYRAFYFN